MGLLEQVDDEDQSSYKVIDLRLRTCETVKGYLDAKMRAELYMERTAKLIDGVDDSKAVLRQLKEKSN